MTPEAIEPGAGHIGHDGRLRRVEIIDSGGVWLWYRPLLPHGPPSVKVRLLLYARWAARALRPETVRVLTSDLAHG